MELWASMRSCVSSAVCICLVIVFVSAYVYEQGSRLTGPQMQLNACRYAREIKCDELT
jgi:hypothetical protein